MPHSTAVSGVSKTILALGLILGIVAGLILPSAVFAQSAYRDLPYEVGFYYTAKKGESVVDISKRFFGTDALWPQIWADNKHLHNPYSLKEGSRVRLYQMAGNKKVPRELLSIQLPETQAPFAVFSPIDSVGFVRTQPVKPIGMIFRIIGEKELVGEGDQVFLWISESEPWEVGKRYTAYRNQPVPGEFATPELGAQHLLSGVIEIRDIKPRYAIAVVVNSYRSMHVNDLVMPMEERSPIIPLAPVRKGLKGIIVSSETDDLVNMGDGNIAFIDKGTKDGVRPGQQYMICQYEQWQHPVTKAVETVGPFDFGTLLVLIADEAASTVVITQADHQVNPGTPFRAPSLME